MLSRLKEWFIIIDHQQKGPYSLSDLRRNPYFTPDTLVWKEGFPEWVKARFVPEMQEIFKDDAEPQSLHELEKRKGERNLGQESQALTLQQDPYPILIWILLFLLLLFYMFYQVYYRF